MLAELAIALLQTTIAREHFLESGFIHAPDSPGGTLWIRLPRNVSTTQKDAWNVYPRVSKKGEYFTIQTKEADEILVQTCSLQPFEWSVSPRAGRGVEPPARATMISGQLLARP